MAPILVDNQQLIASLVSKYGGAVPRYTSYPTAPEWRDEYDAQVFSDAISRSNQIGADYSLYLHIPFCETQCYYCGCNVVISKEHGIADKYLKKLKEELSYLAKQIDPARKVIQMAWGGGTPTFLTPEQIQDLYQHIKENFSLYPKDSSKHEYSIEIDPRVTSKEHLQALFDLGMNRLSMGIQDFNPATQENINRIQSYEEVSDLVAEARQIGFESINFDLIYGLPHQSLETFKDTITKVKVLDPERIAFFNYAHIPSMFPFQKKYIDEAAMPNQDEKTKIFDYAIEEFTAAGYEFIGMDHFAKPEDELSKAQKNKTLYRNFQGFTTHSGCDLFGAGITAISDVAGIYKQNYKKLNDYYNELDELPEFGAEKFKLCAEEDIARRNIIKQLMCNYEVTVHTDSFAKELELMQDFVDDALVELLLTEDGKYITVKVTEIGKFLVRNISSVFDSYLLSKAGHKEFSKAL